MECKKCGAKDKIWACGLCGNCYNNFYYYNRRYGINFKDYLLKDVTKLKPRKRTANYEKFCELYSSTTNVSTLSKILNVSRQSIYKFIEKYYKAEDYKNY